MKISLAGPSYTSRSVAAAAQQTMNLYPEAVELPNEPNRLVLYGRPGLELFVTVSPAKIRAMWSGGGRLFVVHASNFSEITEARTITTSPKTVAQTVPPSASPGGEPDPAQIFSNGHQLMIISGGLVYCDNGAGPDPVKFVESGHGDTVAATTSPPAAGHMIRINDGSVPFDSSWNGKNIYIDGLIYTISGVVDPDLMTLTPSPPDAENVVWDMPNVGDPVTGITGGFLDGYFIVQRPPAASGLFNPPARRRQGRSGALEDPGRQFNISKVLDGTYWHSLDFGVKEGASDYLRSILCDHEELYLFGTETSEIWSNVGDPNFPFQRNPGAFIHEGAAATFSQCSVGLTVCGLAGGATGAVIAFQLQGLQPKRISTHAQEEEWNQAGYRIQESVSYGYTEGGHTFWVVNFWRAGQGRTWVYDLTTQLWHERAAWSGSAFTRYQPWYHVFIPEWGTNGEHIVGDPGTGKLYRMSTTYADDDGASILYRRAFPHLIAENQFGYAHRLEVLAEMGALEAGDPVPQMVLDWSKDYGHTFINARSVPMAAAGQYTKRAVWRRLGKARDSVPRVSIDAKVKIALIDAYLESTQGFA
jgi:hypothetical protein